jgi:hypothetical protein
MPRLYDGAGNRLDSCFRHYLTKAEAIKQYAGPDFSYNEIYPDYMKGDLYYCHACGCLLTEIDQPAAVAPVAPKEQEAAQQVTEQWHMFKQALAHIKHQWNWRLHSLSHGQ